MILFLKENSQLLAVKKTWIIPQPITPCAVYETSFIRQWKKDLTIWSFSLKLLTRSLQQIKRLYIQSYIQGTKPWGAFPPHFLLQVWSGFLSLERSETELSFCTTVLEHLNVKQIKYSSNFIQLTQVWTISTHTQFYCPMVFHPWGASVVLYWSFFVTFCCMYSFPIS